MLRTAGWSSLCATHIHIGAAKWGCKSQCSAITHSLRLYSTIYPTLTVLPAALPTLPFLSTGVLPLFTPAQVALHYQKHHKAYVDKLNALLRDPSSSSSMKVDKSTTVESLMLATHEDPSKKVLFNQAAQHFNHTFFWDSLRPSPSAAASNNNTKQNETEPPEGPLRSALVENFGSVKLFMETFEMSGINNFGSGWVWLCVKSVKNSKSLVIVNTSNAGCPITAGLYPILTADVWEHAYYKDFENRRADYLKEFWTVVNWEKVVERYRSALSE